MKKLLSILLTSVLISTLVACNNNGKIKFDLVGNEHINYTLNESYVEQGFIASDGNKDLKDFVTITGEVDKETPGDYTLSYTLDYQGETQTLKRVLHYRGQNCQAINVEGSTMCTVNFSQYLNTYIKLTIYYDGATYHEDYSNIFDTVENIIADYHKLSDKYKNYDGVINVKSINDNPTATHTIDARLFDMIKFAMDHQSEVNNLFNIALGPVLQVWHDYRELADPFTNTSTSIPTMAELNDKNQYTDYTKIILDDTNKTITMDENMSIDLGGMSKGYISEILTEYLDSLDLSSYLLNNGNSNISIGGTHPVRDHGKFILAVTDPTNEKYPGYASILLGDGDQLVTSGDYQQYFIVDDVLYHHIINPLTLMPERYSRSVSIVINGDAGLADLYSTAIFTMNIEDGIAFVDSVPGLEAIWYGVDGTIYFSKNFEELYLNELY